MLGAGHQTSSAEHYCSSARTGCHSPVKPTKARVIMGGSASMADEAGDMKVGAIMSVAGERKRREDGFSVKANIK